MKVLKSLAIASIAAMAAVIPARPCSRVVFLSHDTDIILVGRTLDWRNPIPTNIYVYPRGVEKQSMPSGPRFHWTSQYGSVVAVGYDGGVTEGMNEKGLVMNGLFCKGTIYKTSNPSDTVTPVMSMSMFVSYFLDNFATVDEMYTYLSDPANTFAINGQAFDGGTASLLHWGITDATGETMVMEWQDSKLNLYRGRDLRVLTNDPAFPLMQGINDYWKQVNGVNFLPGTVRSSDRFARASFFINHVPDSVDYNTAMSSLQSIMGTVSVPFGYEIQGEPNVSSTQWRSTSDSRGGKYYFKFADSLNTFYVDLNSILLTPGAPILKLDTKEHADFVGCINSKMKVSEGFNPMW